MEILILLIIDQVAKWLAKLNLQPSSICKVIKNVISITYVENRGAAFGMMSGKQLFLKGVTIVAIGALLYYYFKTVKNSESKLLKIAISMLSAGAIGNFIDRLCLNYVIDFIKLEFIDFAIFNFADIYICVGSALLCIYIAFFDRRKE